MTLQKLLDLKLIHDNVHILVDNGTATNTSKYEEEFQVNRIMGRVVTKDDLIKAGVREELFTYQVESIWGDKKYKMGIVIKEQKKKGKI